MQGYNRQGISVLPIQLPGCEKQKEKNPKTRDIGFRGFLASTRGFEPPTYRLGGGRSILLSYVDTRGDCTVIWEVCHVFFDAHFMGTALGIWLWILFFQKVSLERSRMHPAT